ncbi:MAG: chloramphenicol phosphotransferase [Pseudomonadota bacterium]
MTVIFLNGCTSAGKSSIARELQSNLPEHYLLTGIDDAFAMLPPKLHGHKDGFYFDRDDANRVRLNFGAFGLATLKAHRRACAAIAKSSVNLILDEVVLAQDMAEDWISIFEAIDVFWVGVHCRLEELNRREIARGDRIHGQAEGQYDIVHKHLEYDFEIDTSDKPPSACAAEIMSAFAQR